MISPSASTITRKQTFDYLFWCLCTICWICDALYKCQCIAVFSIWISIIIIIIIIVNSILSHYTQIKKYFHFLYLCNSPLSRYFECNNVDRNVIRHWNHLAANYGGDFYWKYQPNATCTIVNVVHLMYEEVVVRKYSHPPLNHFSPFVSNSILRKLLLSTIWWIRCSTWMRICIV